MKNADQPIWQGWMIASMAIQRADNKKPQPGHEAAKVVADGCEHGVVLVAEVAGEVVAVDAVAVLQLADSRLEPATQANTAAVADLNLSQLR